MAGEDSYLTLTELVLSYVLLAGLGWLVAGRTGVWVAGALVTAFWSQAIFRAAHRGAHQEPSDRRSGPR